LAAIILLSAGLSDLNLLSGQLFSVRRREMILEDLGTDELPWWTETLITVLTVSFGLAQLLLPFAIIYLIISPKARKEALRTLVIALWILAIFAVIRARPGLFDIGDTSSGQEGVAPGEAATAVEFAASPPQWLVFAASLVLAVLVAILLLGAIWLVWQRVRRPARPLEQLAQEAQDAVEALRAGADLKNTVMRCYFEMSRVLSELRGIKRSEAMTTREFEQHLAAAGLPSQEVRQLTRLFEGVRYGAESSDKQEERQAIACLSAIVEACRSST
jgi:hypothetical protein